VRTREKDARSRAHGGDGSRAPEVLVRGIERDESELERLRRMGEKKEKEMMRKRR
jgi:hypothetical protein